LRVFISHQRADAPRAVGIRDLLTQLRIDAYVDALDDRLLQGPDDLGEYFRREITASTHLLAVLSGASAGSWWVPFEIGVATQNGNAISSFATSRLNLPDFLTKWPMLSTQDEIVDYVRASTDAQTFMTKSLEASPLRERAQYANRFHADLKRRLGQR
jgi:hypothetical protein